MKLTLAFVAQGMFAYQDLTKLRRIGKLLLTAKLSYNELHFFTANFLFKRLWSTSTSSSSPIQLYRKINSFRPYGLKLINF